MHLKCALIITYNELIHFKCALEKQKRAGIKIYNTLNTYKCAFKKKIAR